MVLKLSWFMQLFSSCVNIFPEMYVLSFNPGYTIKYSLDNLQTGPEFKDAGNNLWVHFVYI